MNITLTGDLTIAIVGPFAGKLATLAEPARPTPPPCAPVVPMPGEPLAATLGRSIRSLRKARRWSQAELAELMTEQGQPLSQVTVGRLEAARRPVNVDELAALARIFKVTMAEFVAPLDAIEEG